MKLSATFLETLEQESSGTSNQEKYLRYTKLPANQPVNFALLEQDPLSYWLVWADPKAGGNSQPFRFVEKPTDQEIELEIGNEYIRSKNFEGTAIRKPNECLTWPVYNWDSKTVQVLEVSHISLSRQFAKYGLNKKYSKNLLDWDFELKKIQADMTRYELLIVPRDEDEHDEVEMAKAWRDVERNGFNLNRLVGGGDPFSES